MNSGFVRRASLDEDIPTLVKENIGLIFGQLKRYYDYYRLREVFSPAIDYDDLFQEMLLTLVYEVVPKWDASLNVPFSAFARLVMRRRVSRLIYADRADKSLTLEEWMASDSALSIVDAIESVESALAVLDFAQQLTSRQRQILNFAMSGDFTIIEIAKGLQLSKSTVGREMIAIREQYVQHAMQEHMALPEGILFDDRQATL